MTEETLRSIIREELEGLRDEAQSREAVRGIVQSVMQAVAGQIVKFLGEMEIRMVRDRHELHRGLIAALTDKEIRQHGDLQEVQNAIVRQMREMSGTTERE